MMDNNSMCLTQEQIDQIIDLLDNVCNAILQTAKAIADTFQDAFDAIADAIADAIRRAAPAQKKRPPLNLIPHYAGCVQKVRYYARSNC